MVLQGVRRARHACIGVRASPLLAVHGDSKVGEQSTHALFDVVADGSNSVDVLSGRIGQVPVLISLAGEDRTGVPTAHGHDDVGGLNDLVSPGFRELTRDVDANLCHCLNRRRVDFIAGFGPTRPRDASPARWVKNPRAI